MPVNLFGYRLLLKTENWKHCSKIIFKCVNSVVGPSFNLTFIEIRTCKSREQCMRPSQKNADVQNVGSTAIQTHTIWALLQSAFKLGFWN